MGSFTPYEKANPLCISILQNQSVSRSVSKNKSSLKRSKSDIVIPLYRGKIAL